MRTEGGYRYRKRYGERIAFTLFVVCENGTYVYCRVGVHTSASIGMGACAANEQGRRTSNTLMKRRTLHREQSERKKRDGREGYRTIEVVEQAGGVVIIVNNLVDHLAERRRHLLHRQMQSLNITSHSIASIRHKMAWHIIRGSHARTLTRQK